MKRTTYNEIGGFDETLHDVLMAEDMELAVRLQRAGYTIQLLNSIPVLSSFRRIQQKPVQTTILRMVNVFRHTRR